MAVAPDVAFLSVGAVPMFQLTLKIPAIWPPPSKTPVVAKRALRAVPRAAPEARRARCLVGMDVVAAISRVLVVVRIIDCEIDRRRDLRVVAGHSRSLRPDCSRRVALPEGNDIRALGSHGGCEGRSPRQHHVTASAGGRHRSIGEIVLDVHQRCCAVLAACLRRHQAIIGVRDAIPASRLNRAESH